MKPLALLAVVALLAGPSQAQFLDGNELYEKCTTYPIEARGYAMGIIDEKARAYLGVTDAGDVVLLKQFACFPTGITGGQARDVVCKYLEDHPESRQNLAVDLAHTAFVEAWPCQ